MVEGEEADAMYFVVAGSVEVVINVDGGKTLRVATLKQHQYVAGPGPGQVRSCRLVPTPRATPRPNPTSQPRVPTPRPNSMTQPHVPTNHTRT